MNDSGILMYIESDNDVKLIVLGDAPYKVVDYRKYNTKEIGYIIVAHHGAEVEGNWFLNSKFLSNHQNITI